jgi:hypothetical protein
MGSEKWNLLIPFDNQNQTSFLFCDDDDDVYLDKLQTRGVKKSTL